jgi:hypothetical protein
LSLDERTKHKHHDLSIAMGVTRGVPMCMHLQAGKDKPEKRVLMKLFDYYNCREEAEGTWWLMEGPDERNNCLLSWSFMQPHMSTAKLGWNQHQYTDYTKVNTTLHGAIYQDSRNCDDTAYSVDFLIKDSQNRAHRVHYDAK